MNIKSVLVVDDSRLARLTLSKLLTKRGIEVEQAGLASEAFKFLETAKPDLVFMDGSMPEMDGFEANRRIRANASTADIKIAMYSAEEGAEAEEKARASGALAFLHKPATDEKLEQVFLALQSATPAAVAPTPRAPSPVPAAAPIAASASPSFSMEDVRKAAQEAVQQALQGSGSMAEMAASAAQAALATSRGDILQAAEDSARNAVAGMGGGSSSEVTASMAPEALAEAVQKELGVKLDEFIGSAALSDKIASMIPVNAGESADGISAEVVQEMVDNAIGNRFNEFLNSAELQDGVAALSAQSAGAAPDVSSLDAIKSEAQRALSTAKGLTVVSVLALIAGVGSYLYTRFGYMIGQ